MDRKKRHIWVSRKLQEVLQETPDFGGDFGSFPVEFPVAGFYDICFLFLNQVAVAAWRIADPSTSILEGLHYLGLDRHFCFPRISFPWVLTMQKIDFFCWGSFLGLNSFWTERLVAFLGHPLKKRVNPG